MTLNSFYILQFHLTAVHFETNIGDTAVNMKSNRSDSNSSITITNTNVKNKHSNGKIRKNHCENLTKFELDDLSIPTERSLNSEMHSSDSDTLRNSADLQPLKVFIRRTKPMPLTPMPKALEEDEESIDVGANNGNHSAVKGVFKSPRSLFLGLCDD